MTALTSFAAAPVAASAKAMPVLEITHGLHQGVSLPLDKSVYIVGSAATADVLLSDAGIVERHMALRFTDGHVAVEAIGEDVIVRGAHARDVRIHAGNGYRARLPVTIRLGEARLTLSRGDTVPPRPMTVTPVALGWPLNRRWIIASLLMFLCVGAFAFRGEPVSPLAMSTIDKTSPSPAVPERGSAAPQAKAWLEQRLTAAGLDRIEVSQVDGQLSARGSYGPTQKSQWISVRQAFDSRFGQQVMLLPSVVARPAIDKPRVRFQAVWFGRNPYVINDSGERLYPGAALSEDWTLERIENDQVILARGEERFTFTL